MYSETNIDGIIAQLNENIYSVKTADVTFRDATEWTKYKIDPDHLKNYIIERLVPNDEFVITVSVVATEKDTDSNYYARHRQDAEIYAFGIPFFILTAGVLLVLIAVPDIIDGIRHLIVNKHTQSCKLTFYVRRKYPNEDVRPTSLRTHTAETRYLGWH